MAFLSIHFCSAEHPPIPPSIQPSIYLSISPSIQPTIRLPLQSAGLPSQPPRRCCRRSGRPSSPPIALLRIMGDFPVTSPPVTPHTFTLNASWSHLAQVGTPLSTFTYAVHARHLLPAFYGSFAAEATREPPPPLSPPPPPLSPPSPTLSPPSRPTPEPYGSFAVAHEERDHRELEGGGGGGGMEAKEWDGDAVGEEEGGAGTGGAGGGACARVTGSEGGLLWFGSMPSRCEVSET